jgi:hypothetical protein
LVRPTSSTSSSSGRLGPPCSCTTTAGTATQWASAWRYKFGHLTNIADIKLVARQVC